jgi:type IV secretion system protein VirB11
MLQPNDELSRGSASNGSAIGVAPETSLDLALKSLRPWLTDPELTELCVYTPGEAFIERARTWTRVAMPFASFEWCVRLAKLVGNATRQLIDEGSPLLSAGLPTGERVQFAIPPATLPKHVAIAIRRPSQIAYSITQLVARVIFLRTSCGSGGRQRQDEELRKRLEARDFGAFMHLAVRYRKNILVSGPTGSGKTTWTKALIRAIPAEERLIAIEDAAELSLDFASQPRAVVLQQGRPGKVQGHAQGTARGLPAVAARSDLVSGTAIRGGLLLLAEHRQRPSRVHHFHSRRELRARV